MLFRRRLELAAINVGDDWAASGEWTSWEAPRNAVRGESHYRSALKRLTGLPRRAGYLIPVGVDFVRERDNKYDPNAFRAEVAGEKIGYLAREIAAMIAKPADKAHCSNFRVCGVLRGGSLGAPDVGVHVWLDRRLSPGLEIEIIVEGGLVEWPPGPEGLYCSADETDLLTSQR